MTGVSQGRYDLDDLVDAWIEHDYYSAQPTLPDFAVRRATALEVAFALEEREGRSEWRAMLEATIRAAARLTTPFDGWSPTSPELAELTRVSAPGIDSAAARYDEELRSFARLLVVELYGVDPRATVGPGELIAAGWDPAEADPGSF